ncbi:aldolase catalytic domain-containing protein [Halopseudomonas phragmitis]|uniref:Aldolase n=1 Tax=Halopseudomonas phragmitis TaxID=1931241 RepID=A0A1V0B5S4_9GAMM|nr:aldolase catalytic domain-containing protein [Halopseudomonas phragmitis]AQZ95279.1 aldolase [Halopseudomonas phragmitis]
MKSDVIILDCTLRDGGYYNAWNFDHGLVNDYLQAMSALGVSYVELGLRSLRNDGFKGACAFTTEEFVSTLQVPDNLTLGVMVNAVELVDPNTDLHLVLEKLFPVDAENSRVKLVRIACHVHEFSKALPASAWLKERGFSVGFNLMQVADRSQEEVEALAEEALKWPLDVLYFADSMGSMGPDQCSQIIRWLRKLWQGPLGIHTHDNMGFALQNSLRAMDDGVTWLDATVTGMGRGPGNAKTEYLVLELADHGHLKPNITPLMGLIRKFFLPMQQQCGWGTNAFYYLAGKYGIHPTYIQEMLSDSRYNEEDILAVIEHLRVEGGKKFSAHTLDAARHFYQGNPRGQWHPAEVLVGREVLILGSGPGVEAHRCALERYIRHARPFVMALNTQSMVAAELIDARVACHPVRLLADCAEHTRLPQPLITPASMLPEDVQYSLAGKPLLDFGLGVQKETFAFAETYCVLPCSLVIAYALAVANSGKASRVILAGFDGYTADDPRTTEMQSLLGAYMALEQRVELCSITPTRYTIPTKSVYAI